MKGKVSPILKKILNNLEATKLLREHIATNKSFVVNVNGINYRFGKKENVIDCRSSEGQTIGLIDSLIHISREVARKDLSHLEVKEALKDLYGDESFQFVLTQCQFLLKEEENV